MSYFAVFVAVITQANANVVSSWKPYVVVVLIVVGLLAGVLAAEK
jgi:hypothetical protein